MTRLLRVAAVVVLVGGAAAVLSSCSNDPGAIVTTTPTAPVTAEPVSSPSPTPSVTPEEELLEQIPENARSEDFQSATQFSRFFVDLYPGLFAEEPKTELFALLSAPECEFCTESLDRSTATAEAKAHSKGGLFSWPDLLATGGLLDDGFWYLSQAFEITETTTYLEDGTVHSTVPGGIGKVSLKLAYEEGGWRVHGVEFNYDDE